MTHWLRSQNLRNITFFFLLLYCFSQCISIAVANCCLGVCVFFSLLYGFSNREEIKENFARYKIYFYVAGVLFGCLLISALFSGGLPENLKVWFFRYAYRFSPFIIVTLLFPKPKYVLPLILLTVLSCIVTSVGGIVLADESQGWRVKGFFGHPMTLAGFLCCILPLVFSWLLLSIKEKKLSWFCLGSFLFLCTTLLLNETRGAWIACIASFLFITAWFAVQNRRVAVVSFLLVILLGVTISTSERFSKRALSVTSTTLVSNTERLLMWKSASQMFLDHPLTGVGLGNYKTQYQEKYISPEAQEKKQEHAHSNFFQMLGENGLVGLAGYLTFFLFILLKSLFEAWKGREFYSAIIFSITLAIFLQGLTEFNFGNSAVIRCYWGLLAILLVLKKAQKEYFFDSFHLKEVKKLFK